MAEEKELTLNSSIQCTFEPEKIGIIIPAYNAHDTIKKLFHSIALFTFLDKVEVCLVDDCSDKPYDYLIDFFPEIKITILRQEKNRGPGYCRNIGLDWAEKENKTHLLFADADDYYVDNHFWDAIEDIEKDADLITFRFYDEKNEIHIEDFDIWSFAKVYNTRNIFKYHIRFSNNYSNEDVIFNFIFFPHAETIIRKEITIYFWTNRINSLSRAPNYDIDSLCPLLNNLADAFIKHYKEFSVEKIIDIVTNRMIRFWHSINGLMNTSPMMLTNQTEDSRKFIKAFKRFYNICYAPYEHLITHKQIVNDYHYSCTSGGEPGFIWIDYYSLIRFLKEDNKKETT